MNTKQEITRQKLMEELAVIAFADTTEYLSVKDGVLTVAVASVFVFTTSAILRAFLINVFPFVALCFVVVLPFTALVFGKK